MIRRRQGEPWEWIARKMGWRSHFSSNLGTAFRKGGFVEPETAYKFRVGGLAFALFKKCGSFRLVAECLGCSPTTVQAAWNGCRADGYDEPAPPALRGKARKAFVERYKMTGPSTEKLKEIRVRLKQGASVRFVYQDKELNWYGDEIDGVQPMACTFNTIRWESARRKERRNRAKES